jgi:hypothetical protein
VWCNTVANSPFWRVVDQEIVLPIEDVIARLLGHEDVRNKFASIMIEGCFQPKPVEIAWNGADGAVLGRGVMSKGTVETPGDFLRDIILKAGDDA